MVADEKTRFSKKKERVATDALQWLLRGLNFTCLALRHNLDNAEAELAASFANSYETSLKPYHGILVRPAFAVSCSVP
jgi:hypothetical protein